MLLLSQKNLFSFNELKAIKILFSSDIIGKLWENCPIITIMLRLLEKESFSDSNLLVLKLNVSQNKIALL